MGRWGEAVDRNQFALGAPDVVFRGTLEANFGSSSIVKTYGLSTPHFDLK